MSCPPTRARSICRAWLGLFLALGACATRPSAIETASNSLVLVKSARLPSTMPWYTRFAHHGWVDLKIEGGTWRRIEVITSTSGVEMRDISSDAAFADQRWQDRPVRLLATYEGDAAARIGASILETAPDYPQADHYRAWPGANSNTFLEWLSQSVPGLAFEQNPTAVGKDDPIHGWIDAGVTTTRTGLEFETPYLGAQVGLKDGVELHLLGLTLGIDLWPPQIELPFLPAIPWGFF